MSTQSDADTKKDLKRLKEIMLSDDEWKLMKQLTKLLQLFYDATKLLGGEKYATASFMYYVVATLQTKVIPKEIEVVDLTNDNDAFDDDVEFEDGNDDDVVILNESQNKKRKIRIKNPLNCEGNKERRGQKKFIPFIMSLLEKSSKRRNDISIIRSTCKRSQFCFWCKKRTNNLFFA